MKHSTGKPTKANLQRFALFQEIGCICCRLDGRGREPADVHHLVEGGKRLGHNFTIPLCVWHHRGQIENMNARDATEIYGPSLANGSKPFVAKYGTEKELLEITNMALLHVI